MAQLTVYAYRAGDSAVHRLDVRFKLSCLILIALTSLTTGFGGLALLYVAPVIALMAAAISFFQVLVELRYFGLFLLLVLMVRALVTPGDTLLAWHHIALTSQGVQEGALICGRLFLVACLGLVLAATTRSIEVRSAIRWVFTPVPLIPAGRLAFMVGLMVRFLPDILQQAAHIAEAQRARGIELHKNPIRRIQRFMVPFFRRIFIQADNLVMAMEARCFDENRTEIQLTAKKADWLIFAFVIVLCALAGIIG